MRFLSDLRRRFGALSLLAKGGIGLGVSLVMLVAAVGFVSSMSGVDRRPQPEQTESRHTSGGDGQTKARPTTRSVVATSAPTSQPTLLQSPRSDVPTRRPNGSPQPTVRGTATPTQPPPTISAVPTPPTPPDPTPLDPLLREPRAYWVTCLPGICFVISPSVYCDLDQNGFDAYKLRCDAPYSPFGLPSHPDDWTMSCDGVSVIGAEVTCQHSLDGAGGCFRIADYLTTSCSFPNWSGQCLDLETEVSCERTDASGTEVLTCTNQYFPHACTWEGVMSFTCDYVDYGGGQTFACRPD